MVYGLKDFEKADRKEVIDDDENQVTEIAREIGVKIVGKIEVKCKIGRKKEGDERPRPRPRPMLVHLKDEDSQYKLRGNARKLARKQEWNRVYLGPDMTWEQREEARKTEEELRRQNREIRIHTVYRSPNSTRDNDDKLCELVRGMTGMNILIGDFNFPDIVI